MVPPDPFPNSAVKRSCADGSVGFPHVRVGHRQAPNYDKPHPSKEGWGFFVITPFELSNSYMGKVKSLPKAVASHGIVGRTLRSDGS